MPLQATSGAASYDAFGGGVPFEPTYIEQVFATHLYTGNGSTQTITNGIDLAGEGGLVWFKTRNQAFNNALYDTARGTSGGFGIGLISNSTSANITGSGNYLTSFNSDGFTTSANGSTNNDTWASWTFRKQPKFFDVVTYSGNSVSGRLIPHSLGSAPGCIIIKSTNLAGTNWAVWHRSLATGFALQLQGTNAAFSTKPQWFNSSTQGSSTTFEVGNDTDTNETGNTYVAYLFAHNAGGFGLTGTDNVISCGSYTGLSTGRTVTLGYEPQWVLVKKTNNTSNWYLMDNMRGMTTYNSAGKNELYPNLANAEAASSDTAVSPTATGFIVGGGGMSDNGDTYIYIAIRRGPMKTPTSGTSVFTPYLASGSFLGTIPTTFAPDVGFDAQTTATHNTGARTRLIGEPVLLTNSTAAESTPGYYAWDGVGGQAKVVTGSYPNSPIFWMFRRAPGFFDVVCYTGTGVARTVNHNLGVVPELMIVKRRSTADNWFVYSQTLGNLKHIALDGSSGASGNNNDYWNSTSPTSTVFTVGIDSAVNFNGSTYVNYLFATVAGVSKVGSYTGTGTTLQVNCGFTGGARFVLIKRTDSTGDWYVWDSARGIVASTDPYLTLNTTAAEVTTTDWVDTYSAGFELSSNAGNNVNINGASYIFLSVA